MIEAVRNDPHDDCAICILSLGSAGLTQCGQCKRGFHSPCLELWKAAVRSDKSSGGNVPCPLCRAPLAEGAQKRGWAAASEERRTKRRSSAQSEEE